MNSSCSECVRVWLKRTKNSNSQRSATEKSNLRIFDLLYFHTIRKSSESKKLVFWLLCARFVRNTPELFSVRFFSSLHFAISPGLIFVCSRYRISYLRFIISTLVPIQTKLNYFCFFLSGDVFSFLFCTFHI